MSRTTMLQALEFARLVRPSLIDITGDIAVVKVTDECFGTVWTDYLTLIRHEGQWQIVMKAFFNHADA